MIFCMLTLMIPRSVIGYIIFTSLFIKGQYRSKWCSLKWTPKIGKKTTENPLKWTPKIGKKTTENPMIKKWFTQYAIPRENCILCNLVAWNVPEQTEIYFEKTHTRETPICKTGMLGSSVVNYQCTKRPYLIINMVSHIECSFFFI